MLGTDSLFASSILELSPNIAYGLWADTFMHVLMRRIIIVIIFCGSNGLTFLIFVILWLRFQYPSMLSPHSVYIPHLFAENNQDCPICSSYVGIQSNCNPNIVYVLVRICPGNQNLTADARRISRQEHHRSWVIL